MYLQISILSSQLHMFKEIFSFEQFVTSVKLPLVTGPVVSIVLLLYVHNWSNTWCMWYHLFKKICPNWHILDIIFCWVGSKSKVWHAFWRQYAIVIVTTETHKNGNNQNMQNQYTISRVSLEIYCQRQARNLARIPDLYCPETPPTHTHTHRYSRRPSAPAPSISRSLPTSRPVPSCVTAPRPSTRGMCVDPRNPHVRPYVPTSSPVSDTL